MLALLLLIAAQDAVVAPAGDLIVVTADPKKKKCRMKLADRVLSDPEFAAHIEEWRAGRQVRLYAPESLGYKCLARIMNKLADHGVTRARLVDHPNDP